MVRWRFLIWNTLFFYIYTNHSTTHSFAQYFLSIFVVCVCEGMCSKRSSPRLFMLVLPQTVIGISIATDNKMIIIILTKSNESCQFRRRYCVHIPRKICKSLTSFSFPWVVGISIWTATKSFDDKWCHRYKFNSPLIDSSVRGLELHSSNIILPFCKGIPRTWFLWAKCSCIRATLNFSFKNLWQRISVAPLAWCWFIWIN